MRALIALFVLAVSACDPAEPTKARIAAYSTGMGHPDPAPGVIKSYGSHAIRVENAPVEVRIYKVRSGEKTLEHELTLDPEKHPMAWVTPSITDGRATFEFGIYESNQGSGGTPHYVTEFELPKSLGHSLRAIETAPTIEEKLLHYTLVKQDGVELLVMETETIEGLVNVSARKPVDFYLVTVKTK